MTWITVPDENVSVNISAHGYVGTYGISGGVFSAAFTRASAAGGTSAPSTNYFEILLPPGTYTGNTRLTILSNDEFGPYYQYCFTQVATTPPLATGEYLVDLGSISAGDTIYCPAGMDDGSGGYGTITFTLEFETSGPPAPTEFWTDFIGFAEEVTE